MKVFFTEEMENADNVYRTKNYIVFQVIEIGCTDDYDAIFISYDTYIERTPDIDALYETILSGKKNIDGKRLPVAMYTRKYIA